jgi:alpha-L-fucosidase
MCFGKNVSSWSTAAEAGHVSAVRDFVQVHYTTAADTLNAIVSPYPPGSTLTLPSPVLTSGATTTVRLLGDPAPPANGSLGHWPLHAIGQPGVVIAVPPLPANKLPCEHAFTFSIRGAI